MVAFIIIMIGLFFTGVDIHIATSTMYEPYVKTDNIGSVVQTYVTKYIINDRLTIDIFPDVIGCVLLLVGTTMLLKQSKKFLGGYLLIFLSAATSLAVRIIPFYYNGQMRVVPVLCAYFIATVSELVMEFLIIYTAVDISDALPNQSTNKRMQFGWWISVFCRVFIFFLTFVGHFGVMHVYLVANLIAVVFYLAHLFMAREYVGRKMEGIVVKEEGEEEQFGHTFIKINRAVTSEEENVKANSDEETGTND